MKTYPKLGTQEVNDILRHLSEETIYITFYARKEFFKPRASRRGDKSFLSIILPYEEVLENEDNLPLMLSHLAQNVHRLKWLDCASLKKQVEALLRKERNG